MPLAANAFDFEDNPSGSDDQLLQIPQHGCVSTQNTVASLVKDTTSMTRNTMADKDARMKRHNARDKANMPQAGKHLASEPKELTKGEKDELARLERNRIRDNRKEVEDKCDAYQKSCPDGDLDDRLWNRAVPNNVNFGYWDGEMVREKVPGDGNCLIHTMLRCSDYDLNDDKSDYKAKVLKLWADIFTFMVDHANNEAWKAYSRREGFTLRRGNKKWLAKNYDDYCNQMRKDGTYMGDLETQAFCNMRHASFQVAIDVKRCPKCGSPSLCSLGPHCLLARFIHRSVVLLTSSMSSGPLPIFFGARPIR